MSEETIGPITAAYDLYVDLTRRDATIATLTAALVEARGALEWIVNPSTGMSHVIFRQEATFKAERAITTINAALGRVEG